MQKLLLLFLTFIFADNTTGQSAIIKDRDGYSNIRKSPSLQSEIIAKLPNDQIVFVFSDAAEGDWVPLDYYGNKSSPESFSSGYIHRSRFVYLHDLVKFKEVIQNDSILQLQLDSLELTISKMPFQKKGRKIQYAEKDGPITKIDSKIPWGTDGFLPKSQYRAVQLKNDKSTFNFPPDSFDDLFGPNLHMTMAYLDKTTGKLYIEAANSDAAGAYIVIWILKDMKIIGREVFIPF